MALGEPSPQNAGAYPGEKGTGRLMIEILPAARDHSAHFSSNILPEEEN
jgi:hypothetical protein